MGTRGISTKKKAFLLKMELREAKIKAIEIDKKMLVKEQAKIQEQKKKIEEELEIDIHQVAQFQKDENTSGPLRI